jgi:cytidine deaminase
MSNEMIDRRRALGIIATIGFSGYAALAGKAAMPKSKPLAAPAQEAMQGFTAEARRILAEILSSRDFRGQISAGHSKQLQQAEGKTSDQLMAELLPLATQASYAPISNFHVGAVVRGASGALYFGANLEFPEQPVGFTVHAEQAASSNAYMQGERGIDTIAVTAAPCGHCRQFLKEMSPDGALNVLVKGQTTPLNSLLPAAFGPIDLGMKQGALPVNQVSINPKKSVSDEVSKAALAAAGASYAPYSKAYSGVGIRLNDRSIHRGAYIENAAFNPSLPPLQVALISILNSRKTFDQITDVVLVEMEKPVVSQEAVTREVVGAIAPKIRFRTLIAESGRS